jgi:hypothetical protein
MLPDPHYDPPCGVQFPIDLLIPLLISPQLALPEISVSDWSSVVVGAAVPETTVYEYRDPRSGECEIGSAGQSGMEAISKTFFPNRLAKRQLSSGIPAFGA